MSDAGKPFRKLPERPATGFLRLPAWVRGYADEILRIAERPSGRICSVDGALEDIGFALRAHADELPMLEKALALLLAQGELVEKAGLLWYADFAETQRNYEAARKAARRQRDREEQAEQPPVPDTAGHSGTVPQDQRRSDQIESPNPQRGPVRKVRARAEDPEERRRRRNVLAGDAESGFYGTDVKIRLAASRGPDVSALIDELEAGVHPRISLRLALPS